MNLCDAKYALRDLDELDIDNLMCGRITKDALNVAVKRLQNNNVGFDRNYLGCGAIASVADRMLADELNDMLEAGRYQRKKKICA